MPDYFEVVLPDRPPLVRLVRVEYGSAEIECVRTGTRHEFQVDFPTQEAQDEFLLLGKTRYDIPRFGGKMVLLPRDDCSDRSA